MGCLRSLMLMYKSIGNAVVAAISIILSVVAGLLYTKNPTAFGICFDVGIALAICSVVALVIHTIKSCKGEWGWLSVDISGSDIFIEAASSVILFVLFEMFFNKGPLAAGIIAFVILELAEIIAGEIINIYR